MSASDDLRPVVGGLPPQRVVVTGAAGPALEAFIRRTAEALDVPLVPLADLTSPSDVERLAAFDGWVTTGEYDAPRAALVERAEALVHLDVNPTTLTGLVKRTLKRVRADAAASPEQAWLAGASVLRPELPVVRLTRPDDVEGWLRSLS